MPVPVVATTDRAMDSAIILAQNPPPSACATYTSADAELACSFAGDTTPCRPDLRQRVEHREEADGDDRRPPRVGLPPLDLFVDVQGAVPAAVDEHRDQEPG